MKQLWEWRWLAALFALGVLLSLVFPQDSPNWWVPSIYALGAVGGLVVLYRPMARVSRLSFEMQDASIEYNKLGLAFVELSVEPPSGPERLHRLDVLVEQRRIVEERLDGLLRQWPTDVGVIGRIVPSLRVVADRNRIALTEAWKRSAMAFDLLTDAIRRSEASTRDEAQPH